MTPDDVRGIRAEVRGRPAPDPDLPPFDPDRPGLTAPVPHDTDGTSGTDPGAGTRWTLATDQPRTDVPTTVDGAGVEQRIVEAAAVLPTYGGLTGWAQRRWAGARWFDGLAERRRTPRPVPLAVPLGDLRPQPGFRSGPSTSTEAELAWLDGLRMTSSRALPPVRDPHGSRAFSRRSWPSTWRRTPTWSPSPSSSPSSGTTSDGRVSGRPGPPATWPTRTAGRLVRSGSASCGCVRPASRGRA